jgi:hypothetical protein
MIYVYPLEEAFYITFGPHTPQDPRWRSLSFPGAYNLFYWVTWFEGKKVIRKQAKLLKNEDRIVLQNKEETIKSIFVSPTSVNLELESDPKYWRVLAPDKMVVMA